MELATITLKDALTARAVKGRAVFIVTPVTLDHHRGRTLTGVIGEDLFGVEFNDETIRASECLF